MGVKYYRLSFRSQDRQTGTSYAQPRFTLNLPANTFGKTRGGTCKVVLEQFNGYAKKIKAYDSICLSFKDQYCQNAEQTLGVGDYGASRGMGFVSADDRRNTLVHYAKDRTFQDSFHNALIMPCSAFSKGLIQFELKHLDGSDIELPNGTGEEIYQYYVFCLGVYVEEMDD